MPKVPTTTMRLDEGLKEDARGILEELGLNLTSATSVFLRAVVRSRGIPFDLTLDAGLRAALPRRDLVAEYLCPLMSERNRVEKSPRSADSLRDRLMRRRETMYGAEEVELGKHPDTNGLADERQDSTRDILDETARALDEAGVRFAFIHEAAVMAYGLGYEAFPRAVDVLVPDAASFGTLGLEAPDRPGAYSELDSCEPPLRLWSKAGLRLEGRVSARRPAGKGYLVLDPALVLEKLPYSPDMPFLLEQRARLAEVLHADELTDEELMLFHRYVRGD